MMTGCDRVSIRVAEVGPSVHPLRTLEDESLWEQFVHKHPSASGYHTLAWKRLIEQIFGHRAHYLLCSDGAGEITGVLPLILTESRLFGRFLTSMPFFNYGGVLSVDEASTHALLEAASEFGRHIGASHIELRHTQPLSCAWPVRTHKVSMRLRLPADFETLWKGFPSKLRSQIRRGQKEGLSVRVGGEDCLDDFYAVFARCMRDLGTPVYGKAFFRSVVETFPKEVRICVVSQGVTPLAAGLVYGFRNVLEIPWAASDKRHSRLSPNMLLYSSLLEYACQQGFHEFDFGRSSLDSGTYRFKEQWGAKPLQLRWYYWIPDGHDIPQLNPGNPKFKVAIELWRRLPLPLTTWLGPHIVKYLP